MVLMQHAIQIILDKLKLLSVRLFLLERVQQNGPSVNSSFKQKTRGMAWEEKQTMTLICSIYIKYE